MPADHEQSFVIKVTSIEDPAFSRYGCADQGSDDCGDDGQRMHEVGAR